MIKKEYTDKVFVKFISYKNRTLKQSTIENYKTKIEKYLIPYLPNRAYKIKEKSFVDLLNYFEEENISHKTISDIITLLNQFLSFAYKNKYIKKLIKIENLKVKDKKIEIFTRLERSRLKEYLINHLTFYTYGILLKMFSGIRLGELAALQFSDLNKEEKLVKITKTLKRVKNPVNGKRKTIVIIDTPKSNASIRDVPIPDFLFKLLDKLPKHDAEDYILTGNKHHMDMRTIQRRFAKICILCEITVMNIHILRHTYATYALEDGLSLEAVSKLLGHASLQQTKRYLHLTTNYLKTNVDKLDVS